MQKKFYSPFVLLLSVSSLLLLSRSVLALPYVCVETNIGQFCMELLEDVPGTTENFLNYVEDGDYDNTFVHRSVPGFIFQAGGYRSDPLGEEIPMDATIPNEYRYSNTRGTVAMAKLPDDPDSASNEWFINLGDNSSNLNVSNGGYTVFALVVTGLDVVDQIGNSQRADLSESLGGAFTEVPVLRKDEDGVGTEDLVLITRVFVSDDVIIEDETGSGGGLTDEEKAELYACTADWVAELEPDQVCMDTTLGEFCIDLETQTAPLTVANFLHYVADGDYDNTIIHRSVPGFVVQGGGFSVSPLAIHISEDDAITNEFNLSNIRGAVSMAKLGGNPDSATSEWFINLANNSAVLDTDNGGYTVFGHVSGNGMDVADTISSLEVDNLSYLATAFTEMPLLRADDPDGVSVDDFVLLNRAYIPGAPRNPCLPQLVPTLTELRNGTFTLPIRVNNNIYRIIMRLVSSPPEYSFSPDLLRIVQLADTGQQSAVYTANDGILRIPSIRTGETVLTDVELTLIDPQVFTFSLQSYTQAAPLVDEQLTLPVLTDDGLFRVTLNLVDTSPDYVFTWDQSTTVALVPGKRRPATYSEADGILRIPAVTVGDVLVTDIVLTRTDPNTFTLQSYNLP